MEDQDRHPLAGRAGSVCALVDGVRPASPPAILAALRAQADAAGKIGWTVSVDSTISRAHQHAAGAHRNGHRQKEPPGGIQIEPAAHALGRSRGGLTTKTHLACEQGRKVLVSAVTARSSSGAEQDPRPAHRRQSTAGPPKSGPGGQGLHQQGQARTTSAPKRRSAASSLSGPTATRVVLRHAAPPPLDSRGAAVRHDEPGRPRHWPKVAYLDRARLHLDRKGQVQQCQWQGQQDRFPACL